MSSYYNPNSSSPFDPHNPYPEWHSNELILKDPRLRRQAGMRALDQDEFDIATLPVRYITDSQGIVQLPAPTCPYPPPMANIAAGAIGQLGGAPISAPVMFRNFGAPSAVDLSRQMAVRQQGGDGQQPFPMKYYQPNARPGWN